MREESWVLIGRLGIGLVENRNWTLTIVPLNPNSKPERSKQILPILVPDRKSQEPRYWNMFLLQMNSRILVAQDDCPISSLTSYQRWASSLYAFNPIFLHLCCLFSYLHQIFWSRCLHLLTQLSLSKSHSFWETAVNLWLNHTPHLQPLESGGRNSSVGDYRVGSVPKISNCSPRDPGSIPSTFMGAHDNLWL